MNPLPADKNAQIRIAVVIPWFGRELRGGAERHAWELAARLSGRGHVVEVLTTCCRSHQDDWAKNHFSPGISTEPEGFSIRRFQVVDRNRVRFDEVNAKLLRVEKRELVAGISPVSAEDESAFVNELMQCPDLLDYIRTESLRYSSFLFLPYLYFTTLKGLPLVAEKSVLIPCLHMEAYAYLPSVRQAFQQAGRILFLSEGEANIAASIFGPGIYCKSSVAGAGVEMGMTAMLEPPAHIKGLTPFALCLGRQDPGKNTLFLAQMFAEFKAANSSAKLKLVFAGPGKCLESNPDIGLINLGEVSEQDKHALLGECVAIINPSTNESYSRVIFEAWHLGRPAIVHKDCLATASTVIKGGGGWVAATRDDWIRAISVLDRSKEEELAKFGERGKIYAQQVGSWDSAIQKYELAIFDVCKLNIPTAPKNKRIHQLLSNIAYGDAITNQAIWIKKSLREAGYESDIFALDVDDRLLADAKKWEADSIAHDDAVIYHHSIGTALTASACSNKGPKALIYHNITPHELLESYLPYNARLCREGRSQLPDLARYFPVSSGVSIYNAIELSECSFIDPMVLPICVSPTKWNIVPDPEVVRRLSAEGTNVIFVGRVSPNKKQETLIAAFAEFWKIDHSAHLYIIGSAISKDDLYLRCLRELVETLGLSEKVTFTGGLTDAELAAYYQMADLYWSMSEHEGFCVPLIEAMWFNIPVLAYATSAVPETMGNAGKILTSNSSMHEFAQQAFELVHKEEVRSPVLEAQRERRLKFLPENVERHLWDLVNRLEPRITRPSVEVSEEIEDVKSIAVVKLDHIGDLLLATPVFYSLKAQFPDATVTAIVDPGACSILNGNPHVDEVVRYDAPWFWREPGSSEQVRARLERNWKSQLSLSTRRFDLIVNLRSDHTNVFFASMIPHKYLLSYVNDCAYPYLITHPLRRNRGMHITRQHRELLRTIGCNAWCEPFMYCENSDIDFVRAHAQPEVNTVCLALGAGVQLKRWSPVKFREIARRLRMRGIPVSIVGSAADRDFSASWASELGCKDLCGQLNLNQLYAYFRMIGCLVSNDSAPMHIAAAAGLPVVYIIRPQVYEEFAPIGESHRPCVLPGCPKGCLGFDPSALGSMPEWCNCIQSITVDMVEANIVEVMSKGLGARAGADS